MSHFFFVKKMVSTRSQINAAFRSSPLSKSRYYTNVATLVADVPVPVAATATASLVSASHVTASHVTASHVPDTKKPKAKKMKKELPYKSIVQTRSQKLREAYDALLNKANMFHMKHLREPKMSASDSDEVALATFLHNLRTQPISSELVQKATQLMPWFKWEHVKSTWDFKTIALNVTGGLLVVAASVGLSVWAQMLLNDRQNLDQFRSWMKTNYFERFV